jgi:signal peptidase II
MFMKRHFCPLSWKAGLVIALCLALVDQVTKHAITGRWALGEGQMLTSFFNLVHVRNTGAAFSILAQAGGGQRWFFLGLTVVAVGILIQGLRQKHGSGLFRLSLAAVLGGALGNGWDRLVNGYVVDFLQFHSWFLEPLFTGGYFPCFNLADTAITLGVIGLVVDECFNRRIQKPA